MKKIVHLMLCGPVTDGWSYQDNMLTKYHRKQGHEVTIITSKWIWETNGKLGLDNRNQYINEDDVKVIRLSIKNNKAFNYKFKTYHKLIETIEMEKPEILFIHGCQFVDIWKVIDYLKKQKNIKTYIDNHADFSNSGTNFVSKNFLHKIIWRAGAKAIEPYVTKFYGVLPARVEFLINMYDLPPSKVELLVMGADDERVELAQNSKSINDIREKLNLTEQDFLIITGGKIDYAKKQTLLLMEAVTEMDNVNLLIFGSVEEDIQPEFEKMLNKSNRIHYLGWIKSEDTYPYIAASELAVFPGRHSVLWEQTAGQGIPMICKYWDGTTHVDCGGNAIFIQNDTVADIKNALNIALMNYKCMKAVAKEKEKNFRYNEIAKRAIYESGRE